MRYFAAALTCLTVALWFGGVVTLALCVMAVFRAFGPGERETAGRAASLIFIWFGRGQLIVAGLALVGTFLGYLQGRRRTPMLCFALLAVGAAGAVAFNAFFIPRIEELRVAGEGSTAHFKMLHEQSEHLMSGIMLVLLVATLMLPAFVRAVMGDGAGAKAGTGRAGDVAGSGEK